MKVTALLTGRGNNTLKDKNVLDVLGNPVLYYPAKSGYVSNEVTDWYCSSDDEKILKTAEKVGYKRIVRPAELALPHSQHVDCIMHALEVMKKDRNLPEILVVILANNVTIKSSWINECVKLMKEDMTISSVVPVYVDNDHHPLRAKTLNVDGTLSMYEKGVNEKISTNRQDLPKCFFLAHNFWVLNVEYLLSGEEGQQPWGFMGNKIIPYEIEQSIDIHDEIDLYIAQEWIRKNYKD
jgi:CMP-N,N'-diacetyllegionaminic acid synthase